MSRAGRGYVGHIVPLRIIDKCPAETPISIPHISTYPQNEAARYSNSHYNLKLLRTNTPNTSSLQQKGCYDFVVPPCYGAPSNNKAINNGQVAILVSSFLRHSCDNYFLDGASKQNQNDEW